jgi:hypothetical protein
MVGISGAFRKQHRNKIPEAVDWTNVRWCLPFNAGDVTSQRITNVDNVILTVTIVYIGTANSSNVQLWRKITNTQLTGTANNHSSNGYTETFNNDDFIVHNNQWVNFSVWASDKYEATITVKYYVCAQDDYSDFIEYATLDTFAITGGNC